MSQKTLNLCLERYSFVKFGETTKSSHTVLCINNAYSVNSDKYRLTPAAIASKHGEGYVFTLNYDFDRPLFTIVQKSYSIDGTSGKIVFEGIDPISKDGSKYLRRVEVSPVKLSDGSYLLEVTKDEYLRIGTTGAALGDEDLESLNEKIVTMGGIEKSVETVGGKQVLKLDASGSTGAKEIVYFDVDPSDPPSGIYEAIGEALSNNKLPAIRSDGKLYLYTSTSTDHYKFVGVFSTSDVGYETFTVWNDDTVDTGKLESSLGYTVLPADGTEEHPAWAKVCELDLENLSNYTSYGLALLFTSDHINQTDKPSESGIFIFDVGSNQSSNSNSQNASWIAYTEGAPYQKILGVKVICKYGMPSHPAYAPHPFYKAEVWVEYYGGSNIMVNALQNMKYNSFYPVWQGVYKFPENHIATTQSTEPSYSDTEEYTYRYHFYPAESPSVAYTYSQSLTSDQKAQGRDNIGAASASDVTALQSQVSSLSDVSAYSVKGEATVAQLNAGPSGIQAGWAYQLTDSGTLTDGSLAVVAGDTVAWDGTKWFPLVKSDYYATKTYAQNVAASLAPEFDPTRTSENPYKAGESVTYTDGKTYTFTAPHYGAWTGSDVDDTPISPKVEALIIRDKSASTYRICADETGNALMNFVDEEGQTATPRYRARNSVPNEYKRPGTIIEYRLNGNPVSEMYLGGYNLNKFLVDCYWHNCNGDKLLLDYDARMYNNYAIAVENYVKGIVCSEAIDVRLHVAMTTGKRLDIYVAQFDNSTGTYSFVGKLVNLQITSSRETNSPREIIQLTKYASSDPDIYVILDTERIAKESVETFLIGSTGTSAESRELMKKCVAVITVASNFSLSVFNDEISTIKNLFATYRICTNDTGNELMNFVDEDGQEQTPRYRARNSVSDKYKRPGTIIEYRLNGVPVTEMYLGGYNLNKFLVDCYWMNLCDRKLLKVTDAYYYDNRRIAIENYLKDVISSQSAELHVAFYMTTGKRVDIYVARYINGVHEKYVGKLVNLQITSSREENSPLERIKLTKYASSDPDIYVVLDTERIAKESVETFNVGSTSSMDVLKKTLLNYSLEEGGSSGASSYASVFNAVASHSQGLASVGSIAGVVTNDNVTIPNTADNFVAKDINDAFSASLNDMALPVAGKQKFVQPMYNNEKLYVTAFSKERMYLSLSPRLNEYDNTTQYASQYMWFAEKTDLTELVQIQFPQYMVGGESNVVGRKHGLFELANGDALVEVENGPAINANVRQINLYKISGFNGIAVVDGVKVVPPEAVTKVLTFVRNAHLTSFNNFQEYGEGCVILAPYGSGPTARLYLSKDYGSTFELIFCGDTTNVEVVAPKYEVTGDGTGAWPDADHVVGSPIDWTKTLNGNIHVHGIAYDPYYDRIWVVTGDGNLGEDSVTGIWWTDDEGTTWHKYGTMVALTPFCAHGTQMIDVIPMPKCVLFATDGEGDGFYRYNRNGKNGTFSIEGCYQFTGVYSQLKCLGGRYCIREDGVVFQLHHPNTSSDSNIGGVVATLNGYDIHKICDDQFAELGDSSTYKINWNSVIGVAGRTVIVSSNSGGYVTFEL